MLGIGVYIFQQIYYLPTFLMRSSVKPNLLIPLGLEPNLAHSHLSEHCAELNKVDARSE